MEISIEKIIELVTKEVIAELIKKGYKINQSGFGTKEKNGLLFSFEPDMSGFKTPLLTENHFQSIDTGVYELILPAKTIITPGAKDIIKRRKLTVIYKS